MARIHPVDSNQGGEEQRRAVHQQRVQNQGRSYQVNPPETQTIERVAFSTIEMFRSLWTAFIGKWFRGTGKDIRRTLLGSTHNAQLAQKFYETEAELNQCTSVQRLSILRLVERYVPKEHRSTTLIKQLCAQPDARARVATIREYLAARREELLAPPVREEGADAHVSETARQYFPAPAALGFHDFRLSDECCAALDGHPEAQSIADQILLFRIPSYAQSLFASMLKRFPTQERGHLVEQVLALYGPQVSTLELAAIISTPEERRAWVLQMAKNLGKRVYEDTARVITFLSAVEPQHQAAIENLFQGCILDERFLREHMQTHTTDGERRAFVHRHAPIFSALTHFDIPVGDRTAIFNAVRELRKFSTEDLAAVPLASFLFTPSMSFRDQLELCRSLQQIPKDSREEVIARYKELPAKLRFPEMIRVFKAIPNKAEFDNFLEFVQAHYEREIIPAAVVALATIPSERRESSFELLQRFDLDTFKKTPSLAFVLTNSPELVEDLMQILPRLGGDANRCLQYLLHTNLSFRAPFIKAFTALRSSNLTLECFQAIQKYRGVPELIQHLQSFQVTNTPEELIETLRTFEKFHPDHIAALPYAERVFDPHMSMTWRFQIVQAFALTPEANRVSLAAFLSREPVELRSPQIVRQLAHATTDESREGLIARTRIRAIRSRYTEYLKRRSPITTMRVRQEGEALPQIRPFIAHGLDVQLRVLYEGQPGVDAGGLSQEFFQKAGHEIPIFFEHLLERKDDGLYIKVFSGDGAEDAVFLGRMLFHMVSSGAVMPEDFSQELFNEVAAIPRELFTLPSASHDLSQRSSLDTVIERYKQLYAHDNRNQSVVDEAYIRATFMPEDDAELKDSLLDAIRAKELKFQFAKGLSADGNVPIDPIVREMVRTPKDLRPILLDFENNWDFSEAKGDISLQQEFFRRWVQEATPEQLKKFLGALSGLDTLPPGKKVKIKNLHREDEPYFFFMHTCFYQLDLFTISHNPADPMRTFETWRDLFNNSVNDLQAGSAFRRS
ncbi:MAG: hypothetical protein H7A36_01770 [Chlamydiales bacterium]|nr:hypothetical protein [Chlamydiales bacterium]